MIPSKYLLMGVVFLVLVGINSSSAEIKDYTGFINTITFLNGLELTKAQAEKLLPVVREAVNGKEKIEKEILEARQDAIKPYESLKNELGMQKPSKEAEAAANRAHGKVINLYQVKLVKVLLKYERQVDSILTTYQIAYLMKYDAGRRPSKGIEIAKELREEAADLLDTTQDINSFDYDRKKHKLCFDFLNSCGRYNLIDIETVDVMYEVDRMISVLDRARKMFSSNYKGSREDLINELYPQSIQSRPTQYGTKYIRGEPLEVLSKTSRILFTATAIKILEGMAGM